MKYLNRFLFGSLALGLCACSSEEPISGGSNTATEGDVFATLTLNLPSTRSATLDEEDQTDETNSNSGFEIGKDYENSVGSVLVVLVQESQAQTATQRATYNYITCSLTDSRPNNLGSADRPMFSVVFDSKDLESKAGAQNIYVLTYCNPTAELVEAVKSNTIDQPYDVDKTLSISDPDNNSVWGKNGFLMANQTINEPITIPAKETLTTQYNKPETPFDLGTVKVCRVVSRFDFQETTVAGQTEANLYPIYDRVNRDELVGYVKLDAMALVNEAKEFYVLPRVSADGTNTLPTLCGRELPTNWVVSPNYAAKQAASIKDIASTNYFLPLFDAAGVRKDYSTMSFTTFADIAKNDIDNDENWTPGNGTAYHIWRYCTENTIPAFTAENAPMGQKAGITTGIVFRGHIRGVEGSAIAKAISDEEVIYAFGGVLYGNAAQLKAAAEKVAVSDLKAAYDAEFRTDNMDANGDLISSNEFQIYRPTDNYAVYYFYPNRHNDNGRPTDMGAMEFGTVRNNVYKLAVTEINEWGSSPEDPDEPDETPKVYFKVSCEVKPWIVRVNNIVL